MIFVCFFHILPKKFQTTFDYILEHLKLSTLSLPQYPAPQISRTNVGRQRPRRIKAGHLELPPSGAPLPGGTVTLYILFGWFDGIINISKQLMISGGTATLYLHLVQMICYVAIPWILSVHKMQQSWFIDNLKQREWQRWWQKRRRIFYKSPPLSPVLFLLLSPESHIDISNQCILTILIIWDLFARWIFLQTCVIIEPDIGYPLLNDSSWRLPP